MTEDLTQLKEKLKSKSIQLSDVPDVSEFSKEHISATESLVPDPHLVLHGHLSKIYAMAWGPKDQMATASQDGKLLVWDAKLGIKTGVVHLTSSWIMTADMSRINGNLVAAGGLDNICSIYHLNNRESNKPRELHGHKGYISSCIFRGEREMLTTSGDVTSALWNVEQGISTTLYKGHTQDIMCSDVSTDGNTFITGGCDSTVLNWDFRKSCPVSKYIGHGADINSVAFCRNGTTFASGSDDTTCKVFDTRSLGAIQTYSDSVLSNPVTSVCFSSSGRFLFASYDDTSCAVWDTLHGKAIGFMPHADRVSKILVSKDGYCVATSCWDATIRLWTG